MRTKPVPVTEAAKSVVEGQGCVPETKVESRFSLAKFTASWTRLSAKPV